MPMNVYAALATVCIFAVLAAPAPSLADVSGAGNSSADAVSSDVAARVAGDTLRISGLGDASIRLSRSGKYVKINGADPQGGAVAAAGLNSIVLHAGPDTRSVEIDYDSPLANLTVTADGVAVRVRGSLDVTGDLLVEAGRLDHRRSHQRTPDPTDEPRRDRSLGPRRVARSRWADRHPQHGGRVALRPGSLIDASAPRPGAIAGRIEIDGTEVLAAGQIRAAGGQGEIALSAGESGDLSLFGAIDAAGS